MSPLFRGGLAVAGLAGAFAAGFFLKPVPAVRTVVAQVPAETHVAVRPPAPSPAPEAEGPIVRPPARDDQPPSIPEIKIPTIHDPAVKPATELGSPRAVTPEPPDPLDAAGMAMIRRELGHKTTILNKNEPVPAVLASAGTSPGIPKVDLDLPPPPGPVPMGGPMPRLDPPPMPALPTIIPAPPPIAPPPAVQVPGDVKPPALVNTRAVALDFEVTKSGPSRVTAVDLWTTRDGGGTWAKTDRMTGSQSPFRTRLGSDGEYGFRLVMESESGMRTPEPARGETPDVRVVLDTKPPTVVLFPPRPVPGHAGKVQLRWQRTDPHLDPNYIRLEYSADGLAWHAIPVGGARVPGESNCDWAPPLGLPPRVMIRATARDRAGNYATVTAADKVAIDLVTPEGKVTGVRASEPEAGPMPRQVEAGADRGDPSAEPLRSLLPALLASPSVFPPLLTRTAAQPTPWDVSGNDGNPPVELGTPDPSSGVYSGSLYLGAWYRLERAEERPVRTVREWVERLTNTTVVAEPALAPFVRRDPFADPAPEPRFSDAAEISYDLLGGTRWAADGEPVNACTGERVNFRTWVVGMDAAWGPPGRTVVLNERRRLSEHTFAGFSGGRTVLSLTADRGWKPSTATPDSCRWALEPRAPRSPFDGAIDVVVPVGRPPAPAVALTR